MCRNRVTLVRDGDMVSRKVSAVPNTVMIIASATIGALKTCNVAFTKGM